MPSTLWAAPVPALNTNSLTVTGATIGATTLYDISPAQVILLPGQMNVGTRMRIRAYGEYTATAATAAITLGFYMTSAAAIANLTNGLVATSAVIAANTSTTVAVATAWPFMMEWEGHFNSITSPGVGATNAQLMGQGKLYLPTSLVAWQTTGPVPIPSTAALRTVNQTGTPGFGLQTNIAQIVSLGVTLSVTTSFTSITTDELTVELLG